MNAAHLNMVHLPLNQRRLFDNARAHGLANNRRAVDDGYLVHSLFARLFGDLAPTPFDLQPAGAGDQAQLSVLAYTEADHQALAAQAEADPLADAVWWDRAGTRRLPDFAQGQILAFRVRVCPIVRIGKHHPVLRRGAEVDPYVAQKLRLGDATDLPDRAALYLQWLADRLGRAVQVHSSRIVLMRDAGLWRKGTPGQDVSMQGSSGFNGRQLLGRREISCEGILQVEDPKGFASLLARGVGRHRAFGFGMLLLKPA